MIDPMDGTIIRATSTYQQSAAQTSGIMDVYKCPVGYIFEIRRLEALCSTVVDPNTAPFSLSVAGHSLTYIRSGTFPRPAFTGQLICYGQPEYNGLLQVPGVETWDDEEGPLLWSSEWFSVAWLAAPAGSGITISIQGELMKGAHKR